MAQEKIAKIAVSSATYWLDRPYDYRLPPELEGRALPGMRVIVPFSSGNRRTEGLILSLSEQSARAGLKTVQSVLDKAPVVSREAIALALWMRERFFCTVYDAVRAMLPAGLWFSLSTVYSMAADEQGRALAYAAAGRSERKRRILDIISGLGGSCELADIERGLDGADASADLAYLVRRGALTAQGQEKRRVGDKTARVAALAVPGEEAQIIAAQRRRSAPKQAAVLELLAVVGRCAVSEICYFTGAARETVKKLERDGLLEIRTQEEFRRPAYRTAERAQLPGLSGEQQAVYEGILRLTREGGARAALLYGVTGSGKTAIYMRLIEEVLARGKSAILLVPEIALTPQLLETFSAGFGDGIAVLHSSLSIGERYDEWKRARSGEAKVIIGTRSAVFAPCEDLGIIIIDEEQEDSYKSENKPRYHAREVAKYRCAKAGALMLLGSATPDIESMYSARTGKYALFKLQERFNLMGMPKTRIVDMKRELRQGNGGSVSSVLLEEIRDNISRGEQSILFLNRRGAHRLIACVDCGYTFSCPRCSVSLTYHSAGARLMCHYCGYWQKPGELCPDCGGSLRAVGAGTQKLEQELKELIPGVGVLRMDADTVAPAGSHETLQRKFVEEKIPVLIGTRMVAKGLNFENVTLVGVVSADQSLYSGDFRSGERTFSLITQVVGRSGRGERPGRAVIQTFTPGNQTILQAANQDYESFYESEIGLRAMSGSPPFSVLYAITATGLEESAVLRCCAAVRAMLESGAGSVGGARILGPAPLFVVKVNNRFRYRVILACRGGKRVRQLVSGILIDINTRKEFKGISLFADVNPPD